MSVNRYSRYVGVQTYYIFSRIVPFKIWHTVQLVYQIDIFPKILWIYPFFVVLLWANYLSLRLS